MKKNIVLALISFLVCFGSLSIHTDAQAQEQPAQTDRATVLHAGDKLRLYVYGDKDISGEYTIDTRGVLTLPLIGELKADGLSKAQLEAKIVDALVDGGYYTDPNVTLDVSMMQPFYILGEVKNPGSYEYSADLDVFKAIATAGGYTPRADKNDIVVIRKIDGQKVRLKATEDTELLPGDSIKIEQRFF